MAELINSSGIGEAPPGIRRLAILGNLRGTPHLITERGVHPLISLEEQRRQGEEPLVIDSMVVASRDPLPIEGRVSAEVQTTPTSGNSA